MKKNKQQRKRVRRARKSPAVIEQPTPVVEQIERPVIEQPAAGAVPEHELFLTTDEAARMLRVKPSTLVSARSLGKMRLPYVKVGGKVLYQREEIERYITEHTRPVTA